MSAFFVTATGTDIGKTFVTAGLIRYLRGQDKQVAALKPVVSGFAEATMAESDPGVLLAALERQTAMEEIAKISPWRFAAALSPDMAAAREGRVIEFKALARFCREEIIADKGALFIEGVGGVMVPLDETNTVLDWMAALNLPIVLIAGTYLGTLSHTLTALAAVSRRKLKIAALVINESADGVPLNDTMATLIRHAPSIPMATIARGAQPEDFSGLWNLIA